MSTLGSRRDVRGFTLAEILIALAVLGVAGITAVTLLAQLTKANVDGREDVQRHAVATAVMESLLVHEFVALGSGTTSGTAPSGERWTVTISDEDTDLRRLRVEVSSDGRTETLETLLSNRF